METQQQRLNSGGQLAIDSGRNANLPQLPPGVKREAEWQRIGRKWLQLLAQFSEYLLSLFNEKRQVLYSVGLIVSAIITVRLMLAVLDAINDIPLLSSTFELIGIIYVIWLIFRYLIKADTRQELAEKIGLVNHQIVGD